MEQILSWEEKLTIVQRLTPVSINMRIPGNWYACATQMELRFDGILRTVCGDGNTPEKAVEDMWLIITKPGDAQVTVGGCSGIRHILEWNGIKFVIDRK